MMVWWRRFVSQLGNNAVSDSRTASRFGIGGDINGGGMGDGTVRGSSFFVIGGDFSGDDVGEGIHLSVLWCRTSSGENEIAKNILFFIRNALPFYLMNMQICQQETTNRETEISLKHPSNWREQAQYIPLYPFQQFVLFVSIFRHPIYYIESRLY